jgi:hypothetical protein
MILNRQQTLTDIFFGNGPQLGGSLIILLFSTRENLQRLGSQFDIDAILQEILQ